MIYEITPEHFGFTPRRKFLLAAGELVCLILLPVFVKWIDNLLRSGAARVSPWNWTFQDITTTVVMLIVFAYLWSWQWSAYSYCLEIDDNSARAGWRVVRKGHVRYLREFNRGLWQGGGLLQGPRLVLSEHGPLWAQFLGGTVVVPKSLPEYERIKMQVSDWVVDTALHAKK